MGKTWTTVLLALGAFCWATLSAEGQSEPFEVSFSAAAEGGTITVPRGGWSLEVVIRPREVLQVGTKEHTWRRTGNDWRVVFVTHDPDGCPSWLDPESRGLLDSVDTCELRPEDPWPENEEQLEVFPGEGPLGISVSEDPILDLDPELGGCVGSPKVLTYEPFEDGSGGANTRPVPVGPCVGKGEGYGAHSRLPSLVLLADRGPGVVAPRPSLLPGPPRRKVRNLAGFFDSVGLIWRDEARKRRISAHMSAPAGLFSSVVGLDHDVSRVGEPWGSCRRLRSVDGGEPFCDDLPFLDLGTELRAFLVVGPAPTELVDLDGDGRVGASDAKAAGFALYSNEATLRVREHRGETELGIDLDGDGRAWPDIFVPKSPVEVTDPPP